MQRPRSLFAPLLASAIVLLLAAACGQKGPLYLPDGGAQPPGTLPGQEEEQDEKDS
jgi:predicted small lipoprotein YifL